MVMRDKHFKKELRENVMPVTKNGTNPKYQSYDVIFNTLFCFLVFFDIIMYKYITNKHFYSKVI